MPTRIQRLERKPNNLAIAHGGILTGQAMDARKNVNREIRRAPGNEAGVTAWEMRMAPTVGVASRETKIVRGNHGEKPVAAITMGEAPGNLTEIVVDRTSADQNAEERTIVAGTRGIAAVVRRVVVSIVDRRARGRDRIVEDHKAEMVESLVRIVEVRTSEDRTIVEETARIAAADRMVLALTVDRKDRGRIVEDRKIAAATGGIAVRRAQTSNLDRTDLVQRVVAQRGAVRRNMPRTVAVQTVMARKGMDPTALDRIVIRFHQTSVDPSKSYDVKSSGFETKCKNCETGSRAR
ncbi:MAG: hypothetical protein ACKV0T_02785 [Planctomycetales bacterium]